ncbi:hypothetical protein CW751_13665 [Brumimicrobium salinarum]|uniref:OmpA-like domain-containing protein n=1 Tax=Brumimicrobium salinarum TaxID=2058658 RepID=A0A2I0QZC3_9FLAO|nr:OmpA family protein [Brumimicrobium salinarum]PKR79682.1 hypothetical protein CW751_13665 [Brumimicrobium salinarum]
MKNLLLMVLIIAYATSAKGQSKANNYYEAGYYKEASIIFEKEIKKDKGNNKMLQLKLADSYFHLKKFESSIKLYEDLYKRSIKDSIVLIRLAELKRMFCDFDESQQYYSEYDDVFLSKQNKAKFNFEKIIESKINFPQSNINTSSSAELEILKLPQVDKGMGYTFLGNGDLLGAISHKDKEARSTFTTLGVFNSASDFQQVKTFSFNKETSFFNAFPSYCKQSNTLYFTANISDKRLSFKERQNVLQIYSINLSSEDNEPELLSFNMPDYNFTHPAISDNGKRLYFVSNKPGGIGGFDVYYVNKTNDGWSEIKNCGEHINTPFDELTPYSKEETLYFSSYGHNNYGGSDIFKSQTNKGEFLKATNLGQPINSCMNDFSFILAPDSGEGLFTSDRNHKDENKDDVYKVTFPVIKRLITDERSKDPISDVSILFNDETSFLSDDQGKWTKQISLGTDTEITFDHPYYNTKTLKYKNLSIENLNELKLVSLTPNLLIGQVKDDITGNTLKGASVSLYEKTKNDKWELVEVKKTDGDGKWEFHVRKDRTHKVVLEKDNYLTHNEIIPRKNENEKLRNEALTRINPFLMKYEVKKDLIIQIDNIYFDFNSSYIREESFPVLDKVKNFLNENPNINIELSAHTDCIGKDNYNLWLSDRRASRSKKYLVEAGIDPKRIKAKGYGEQKMIVKDCELQKRDDKEAQKNRRVEVKIL